MKVFVALAALLQIAYCGFVSVRLPYGNPAGVTYTNGYEGHAALTYETGAAPLSYAPAAPIQYAAPAIPAKVEAHHVGYAAAQVPAVAAVPFVKHVPTVSQVPVTTFEHHPAVIEKQVDVLKPAVSTKKIEVRRPAIQKQFYDIEERVIIRPAGSALVELEEPSSKLQKGPAIVQPLAEGAVVPQANIVPHTAHVPAYTQAIPAPALPVFSSPSSPAPLISSTPAPIPEEEAVVVDNADFRNAQFRNLQEQSSSILRQQQQLGQEHLQQQQLQLERQQQLIQLQQQQQQLQQQQQDQIQQAQLDFQQRQFQQDFQQRQFQQAPLDLQQRQFQQVSIDFQRQQQQQQQQLQLQQQQQQLIQNSRISTNQLSSIEVRPNGSPLETISRIASEEHGPSVIPSLQSSSEENQINQRRLIDLLTARGGVTEIGLNQGSQLSSVGNAGQIRARVISATPAPHDAQLTDEQVSTKRVVVSRPIETLQEYDVVEPATKLERVAIQQPTFIKTARLDHFEVHGSVPVVGKALTPAVAHAAVPVFQKTISPDYSAYH